MAPTNFHSSFVSVTDNMSQSLNLLLAIVLISVAEGHEFMLYVRAMAIVLHFPIYQVVLPANVLAQTGMLIKLVMFDILEFADFWGT